MLPSIIPITMPMREAGLNQCAESGGQISNERGKNANQGGKIAGNCGSNAN